MNCCFPHLHCHTFTKTHRENLLKVCVFYFSLFLLICETSLDQCSSALLRHRHSHRCILAFAPNNTSAPPINKTRTDFQFLDLRGNTSSSLSPVIYNKVLISFSSLAVERVTPSRATALCLRSQIDVSAGGCLINGVQELYHPKEIQPTARD